MRPKSTIKGLPSIHDTTMYIQNKCVKWLKDLRERILVNNSQFPQFATSLTIWQAAPSRVSCMADCWMADNTKGSFLGVTAHWIEVNGKKWEMKVNVTGFRAISGAHTGWNLGHYLVGMWDCVGICSKKVQRSVILMADLILYSHTYEAIYNNT
jgi:hypothetical protein